MPVVVVDPLAGFSWNSETACAIDLVDVSYVAVSGQIKATSVELGALDWSGTAVGGSGITAVVESDFSLGLSGSGTGLPEAPVRVVFSFAETP